MSAACDVIVIGAGPAGAHAAMEAARHDLRVVLLDEAAAPGGQVWRAPAPGLVLPDAARGMDAARGEALREAVAASGVDWRAGRRVWSVTAGYRVDMVGPDGPESVTAPRVIAATGAHERFYPFPGWTLPGVIGLAGATILLKSQGMLPGRRTIVAGCGPLLAAVAAKIVKGGGTVAAIVDLSSRADWLSASIGMARRPALLREGAGWVASIAKARVPWHFGHAVRAAQADGDALRVTIAPVDAHGAPVAGRVRVVSGDALAVGHGLVPGSEIPRLLQAAHEYDASRGGFAPLLDPYCRTSLAGLYAAGDGAGIAGADPAILRGRLAGLACARDAGRLEEDAFRALADPLKAERAALAPFAAAVARLMRPRPALAHAMPPETIVCRCEDVTRAEIDAAIADGAAEVSQLKHFTRCGMGPCQGRMCGEAAAELVAQHAGSRAVAGLWTMRPPLRPVPLDAMLGTFDYADIPVPEPAPL